MVGSIPPDLNEDAAIVSSGELNIPVTLRPHDIAGSTFRYSIDQRSRTADDTTGSCRGAMGCTRR
jgi:hypothetical protein